MARSVARLSAFAFASVAWTISSGAGIFRNRRERSNRRKNSTSPGKEAGVVEWVCNFRTESMDFVQL